MSATPFRPMGVRTSCSSPGGAGRPAAGSGGKSVLAIRFLLRYLRNRTLYIFSIYCLVVGLLTITLSFVR